MSKPITPNEVGAHKRVIFPDFVFDAFNHMIAAKSVNGRSSFQQEEVIEKIMELGGVRRELVFDNNWLDVEAAYEDAGWSIEYDKPGYNENYPAIFTFKARK